MASFGRQAYSDMKKKKKGKAAKAPAKPGKRPLPMAAKDTDKDGM